MFQFFFLIYCLVLKQQNQQPTPQTLLQMQNSWNSMTGAGNGSGSLPNAAAVNSNIASQIEAINAQQITLQEQIRQSELNLTAQHNVKLKCCFISTPQISIWCTYNIFFTLPGANATANKTNR